MAQARGTTSAAQWSRNQNQGDINYVYGFIGCGLTVEGIAYNDRRCNFQNQVK